MLTRLTRFFLLVLVAVPAAAGAVATAREADAPAVSPSYDADGRLLLPADFRQWVFAGSSLGLSYSEGDAGREMFHHTLIEPTAYDHFVATGEFREGTMLALLLPTVLSKDGGGQPGSSH